MAGRFAIVRVLVIGAGGVGAAAAAVAARRGFLERMILADIEPGRARAAADQTGDELAPTSSSTATAYGAPHGIQDR